MLTEETLLATLQAEIQRQKFRVRKGYSEQAARIVCRNVLAAQSVAVGDAHHLPEYRQRARSRLRDNVIHNSFQEIRDMERRQVGGLFAIIGSLFLNAFLSWAAGRLFQMLLDAQESPGCSVPATEVFPGS